MTDGIIQKVFNKYNIELNDAGVYAQQAQYETDIKIIEAQITILETIKQELIEKIKQEFTYDEPYIGYNVIKVKTVLQKLIGDNQE